VSTPFGSLPPWPAPDVTETAPRGWTWPRRILSILLGYGLGLGLGWVLTVTHQLRVTPQRSALAALNPGLLISSVVLLGAAAALIVLRWRTTRGWAGRLRSWVASRPQVRPSAHPGDQVALFTAASVSPFWLAASLTVWAGFTAGCVLLVRTPLLPTASALVMVWLATRNRVRVWAGPAGVRISSVFRRRLFHTPLAGIRAVKTVPVLLNDSAGPVLGWWPRRARRHQPGGMVFVRILHDGLALALELADGSCVVCSLPDASRAASLIAGLAGLPDAPAAAGPAAPGGPVAPPPGRSPAGVDDWIAERVWAELRGGRKMAAVRLVKTLARPRMDLRSAFRAVEAIAAGQDSTGQGSAAG
jgi:hypothetical protein